MPNTARPFTSVTDSATSSRRFSRSTRYDLAERYNVARETVKTALRILRDERLIVTRQGSGAFVRAQTERPVGLRPHVEAAFERAHVTIEFAGFSGETLHGVLTEPLDKIRAGLLTPESVTVRILLPDTRQSMALPRLAETQADDPGVRERAERITRRHTDPLSRRCANSETLAWSKKP